MSKLSINDIDLGDVETPMVPYEKRKHVAFLIGSGFSVPCGMPTGRQLNDYVLNIDKAPITFDYSGKLAVSCDGQKHIIDSPYERCLQFCAAVMKEYSKSHEFDYEQFYDFISSDAIYETCYQILAEPYQYMFADYHQLVVNMRTVYNQVIEYRLREDRKTEIKENEFASNKFWKYEKFVKYIDKLSNDYVLDIFSLNHDLLMENLPRTNWLHEGISDGFHSYRSPYYVRIRGRFSDPLLFAVGDAVDDSVWDSGESGELAETCSKVATGKYNLAT